MSKFHIVRDQNRPLVIDRKILSNQKLTAEQKIFCIYFLSLDHTKLQLTNKELADQYSQQFNTKKPISIRFVQRALKNLKDMGYLDIAIKRGYLRTINLCEVK